MQAKAVCLDGVTLSLPRYLPAPPPDAMRAIPGEEATRVEMEASGIRDGEAWRPCAGRTVLYVVGRLEEWPVGSPVRVYGMLSAPRPAMNPGELDFAAHARGDRILARVTASQVACVARLPAVESFSLAAQFEAFRARGHELLWRHIGDEQAGLAAAVLLGEREYIDSDQMGAYVETGTVHLLSISGMHLGILAGCLFLLLRVGLVPRRLGLIAIAVIVVLYARLTDSEAPVVRSAVLVVTVCFALLLGRRSLSWNTLAAAALVVLAMNPMELFRVGAQLSFLCMAVFAWAKVERWWTPSDDALDRLLHGASSWLWRATHSAWWWLVRITLASAAVWLVTLPVTMARFHLCSPIGIVLNPLVWAPMTLAMLSGFLVLLVGGVAPWAGDVCGTFCRWNLELLDGIVSAGRSVPASKLWVCGPDDWWLWGFFGMLALFIAAPRVVPAARWRVGLVAAWSIAAFVVAIERRLPRDELRMTYLAVGHGCCVVIELPDGRTILYDAGHMGSPEVGGRTIAGALWDKGIMRLDGLMLSHADSDHYNAVPFLLERFHCNRVFVSPAMWRPEKNGLMSRAVEKLRTAIDKSGAELCVVSEDQVFRARDARMRVMQPPAEGLPGSDNANSIVVAVEAFGRRALLTGDLEATGLRRLVAGPAYDCDVLLAPHHGSPASSPLAFVGWTTPEWVVISGGFRGDLRRVEMIYGQAQAQSLHTAAIGAVTATMNADGLAVETFLPRGKVRAASK
jgi:competence protein ComEC